VRKIAKLAVSSALFTIDRPYTYRIPTEMEEKIQTGMRVVVPFGRGNRRCEGLVLQIAPEGVSGQELKCIESILDTAPVLTDEQLKLALWMRDRFFCTVYEAARAMLPVGLMYSNGSRRIGDKRVRMAVLAIPGEEAVILAGQKKMRAPVQAQLLQLLAQIGSASVKELCYFTGASPRSVKALERLGVVRIEYKEVFRRPKTGDVQPAGPVILNGIQQQVYDGLCRLLTSEKAAAALLYGVTGSGKTAVYIRLVQNVLAMGKSAIVLVPEIALTPQLMARFTAHFGDDVAVLHSGLSIGERYDEWKRIHSGSVHVVVGTRSAVFAPASNLGLVIIDEEQENTYKSENSPRYHTRDVAKFRCVQSGALLLLGSATPSVESMYYAQKGTYHLFRMDSRYNDRHMPEVYIADMKKDIQAGTGGAVGSILRQELARNIEVGQQSILFINRRGSSPLVTCGACGYTYTCPNCSVSMTYHSANRRLMCHYCGHSEPIPVVCPDCGGRLKFVGAGTQKVEEELKEIFPNTEIIRMDADTVSPLHSHEQLLNRFQKERIPILLGTQMVTKGLDFENVTLVGVLSADASLYVNDYRAHERTFSLITQVVGRSGRGGEPGRAVIQTYTPNNEVICLAARQDYDAFYAREIEIRKVLGSPPVSDLITVTASGQEESVVLRGCMQLKYALLGYFREVQDIKVLGPAPAAVMRVNNRYRYRVSVVCRNTRQVRDTIAHVLREFSKDKRYRGIAAYADTDPLE
jgi:primosomal protein N' (replication factor Y)